MKTVIIADDLTGANDTGIHIASGGIRTVVQLDLHADPLDKYDAVVFDTDSRSDAPEEAYRKIRALCKRIQPHEPHIIYKKIDSTLRGNIGAEIDAVYDVLQPDLVVIAPAYPQLGRIVRDGVVYVDGGALHTTQAAHDLKTPVADSHMPSLLRSQSSREVAEINIETINRGSDAIVAKIRRALDEGKPYVVFDTETEEHMSHIVDAVRSIGLNAIWCGSAGLAHVMFQPRVREEKRHRFEVRERILLSVGSVSEKTRQQVARIIEKDAVCGIRLQGDRMLDQEACRQEEARAMQQALMAYEAGRTVVLYLSGESEDIVRTHQAGEKLGLSLNDISSRLITALGRMTAALIDQADVRRLIMMGGDTARQVCLELGASELELIDEVEGGAPLIRLSEEKHVYAITKSGGFGDEHILQRMIRYYEGGVAI